MKTITVFTPSYNRAYILPKLYESLQQQSCKDFEWLIVDDGSTDNTEELVASWLSVADFSIRYIRQENAGKHFAINRGVAEAQGKLFLIVDSDDHLTCDAVQILCEKFAEIDDDASFAGISGVRVDFSGKRIGDSLPVDVLDCTALELRLEFGIQGDMAEAYKTSVLKAFPFPEIPGEKFCPEALVWNRIAQRYKLRFINSGYYRCEYRPDGLTAKITKLRRDSSLASLIYYSELYSFDIPTAQKVKAAINYWRFAFCNKEKSFLNKTRMIGCGSLLFLPLGFIYYILDTYKLSKKR